MRFILCKKSKNIHITILLRPYQEKTVGIEKLNLQSVMLQVIIKLWACCQYFWPGIEGRYYLLCNVKSLPKHYDKVYVGSVIEGERQRQIMPVVNSASICLSRKQRSETQHNLCSDLLKIQRVCTITHIHTNTHKKSIQNRFLLFNVYYK